MKRPAVDEDLLIRRALGGCHASFGELVERHEGSVYRFLLRMVSDVEAARDLTQETFLSAWRARASFEGRSRFSSWLLRIAHNLAVSAARKHQVRAHLWARTGEATPEAQSREEEPPEEALRRERRELVARAVAELPEGMREILVLRDYEDASYEEIQEILGIPIGTVRSRLHRARSHLARALTEVLEPRGRSRGSQGGDEGEL